MAERKSKAAPARADRCVLVLQGGGALGAYQAGFIRRCMRPA